MLFNAILATIDGTFFVTLLMAVINIKQQANQVIDYNSSYVWSVWTMAIFAV